MNFFTSDSHFTLMDTNDTIERDFRPFKSVKQMNKTMIKNWNKQAKKGDTIYHLGDFSNFNKVDTKSYLTTYDYVKKLKAKVVLIMGNNEEYIVHFVYNDDYESFKKFLLEKGFSDVIRDGMYLDIKGTRFYLNHYPSKHKDDALNLFGHIHGTVFVKKYGFNVGVDNHYFKLFSEDDIAELVRRIPVFDNNVYE